MDYIILVQTRESPLAYKLRNLFGLKRLRGDRTRNFFKWMLRSASHEVGMNNLDQLRDKLFGAIGRPGVMPTGGVFVTCECRRRTNVSQWCKTRRCIFCGTFMDWPLIEIRLVNPDEKTTQLLMASIGHLGWQLVEYKRIQAVG